MNRQSALRLAAATSAFTFAVVPVFAGTGSATQAASPTFGLPAFPTLPLNGSFEVADPFSANPFGWTNNGDIEAVWPLPTPVTAQDGSRLIQIGPTVSGFRSYTTDISNFFQWTGVGYINKADPEFDYNGADVTITFWYYIPSSSPINAGPFGLKLNAKGAADPNQDNATVDAWAGEGPALITGHTNNQWVQYSYTWSITSLRAEVEANAAALNWTLPPNPDRIKIVLGRFDLNNLPHSGTIYIDNVSMTQGGGGPVGCNRADITDIGDTGAGPDNQLTVDDIIAFVNTFGDGTGCPGAGPCSRADITDIGDTGAGPDGELTVDDIIAFVNAFGDGC